MKKLFRFLPVQLLLALGAAFLLNMVVCNTTVRFFFTFSSLIKEVLEFCLPGIVFFFVAQGIAAFAHNSLLMIGLLLVVTTVSNMLTSFYAYVGGVSLLGILPSTSAPCAIQTSGMTPFISLHLPSLLRADHAMLGALAVGCVLAFVQSPVLEAILVRGKKAIEWGLGAFFIPILPLYIFGFFLKMMRELPFGQLCSAYGIVFVAVIALQLVWLLGAYFVISGFSLSRMIRTFFTAVPSYLTALGTMSSVATLPVSMVCAEQNTKSPSLVHFAMPILANIHLMGDAVATPVFVLATMKLFFGFIPGFATYVVFVMYLCLNMLAVSGVPGGGIIVMLPLLQSLFGFTPEMLSVMMALYVLQDGFGTAANVMGDGALVIILEKISGLFSKRKARYGGTKNR